MQSLWHMKVTDPCLIGYPAKDEPSILGSIINHRLPEYLLVGSLVKIRGKIFTVNISYVPANPKREKLVLILVPREKLDNGFWGENTIKANLPPPKQEEFPF